MSYPMKLSPYTVEAVWGGKRLMGKWNKHIEGDNIAESWELACHEKGESTVINGEFGGRRLSEVVQDHREFLGERGAAFPFFPILIKLIDSQSNLSVQVHPDDEYALAKEGEYGKTEMWYVVDCAPGSAVYCGFKKPISKQELADALNNGNIVDYLNFVQAKKGDCLFIPAGTVHAICGGMTICEIQQNSSITYRLYDYGRTDKNGNARELHIDKALDVTDVSSSVQANADCKRIDDNTVLLAKCKYFTAYELTCSDEYAFAVDGGSFASLTVVEGHGSVMAGGSCITMDLGDTVFLPADIGEVKLYGEMKAIKAQV